MTKTFEIRVRALVGAPWNTVYESDTRNRSFRRELDRQVKIHGKRNVVVRDWRV